MIIKNNFTKIFIFFVFFLLLKTNIAFAKALPPGSVAGDVPANVLLLLDKSGSMNTRMVSGTSIWYPYDVAEDSSGKIYIAQNWRSVKKIDYTTRVGEGNIRGQRNDPNCGNKDSYLYAPVGISIDNDILYVVDYIGKKLVTFNTSGVCQDIYTLTDKPWSVTINNGHLWVSGKDYLWTLNLSTEDHQNCAGVHDHLYKRIGIAADSDSDYFFAAKHRHLNQVKLVQVDNNYCPTGTRWNLKMPTMNHASGIDIVPSDDDSIFVADFSGHRLNKYSLTGSNTNPTLTWTIGKRGNAYKSTTDASDLLFFYPWGIGTTSSLIHLTQYYASHLQSFNLSGTWQKSIGGAAGTRMSGAKRAIRSIVTDTNLTSGANYGFAHWSSGSSSGYTGWNSTAQQGRPCNNNCLRVRIDSSGAAKIGSIIGGISASGGTDMRDAFKIAKQYYNHSHSPIDPALGSCQKNYVILIGDGIFYSGTYSAGLSLVRDLQRKGIKTYAVAYGPGINAAALIKFNEVADAGGTGKAAGGTGVIEAIDEAALKTELGNVLAKIISEKLTFTAPSITANIEDGGSLYQAIFNYEQNEDWWGTITRTKISPEGDLDDKDVDNWSAAEKVPDPGSRKIWTVLKNNVVEYKDTLNNFHENNSGEIKNLMELTLNTVGDYHRATNNADGSTNNKRCASKVSSIADDNDDDVKGLINFIRGEDYFDYDGDCILDEQRKKDGKKAYMSDIYHSELIVVGRPKANMAYITENQEAYWRSLKNYESFEKSKETRDTVIYAGSNSGILHAIDAKTGVEKWGFIPPLLLPQLPKMVNANLNKESPDEGGSTAIFGVDGSAAAHDMYFQSPHDTSKKWHTVLFIPYGRGGAGFTALDVTNPNKPLHLYSLLNDFIGNIVHHMDYAGTYKHYPYISLQYGIEDFNESVKAVDNYDNDDSISSTCKTDSDFATNGDTSCFKGSTWTMPIDDVKKSDIEVTIDGCILGDSKFSITGSAPPKITFNGKTLQFSADPGDTIESSDVGIRVKNTGNKITGVQGEEDKDYDYSALGETWSAPRVIRLPLNTGDVYAAVMGGGSGVQNQGIGSNVHIVNLEDNGKLIKRIDIEDLVPKKSGSSCSDLDNNIVNSVPGSPVVITADTAPGISWKGAMVYVNDFEGKITKINLTDMSDDGTSAKKTINLYDQTTLFTAESTPKNGRYMYHGMDATIGGKTNNLWLFAGTGNFSRINDTTNKSGLITENLMIGITDPDFPNFAEVNEPADADDLTKCKDTTTDTMGTSCPESKDRGWYIKLNHHKKVTSEPTVFKGKTYFPIYKPVTSGCALGDAYICGVDDECGTNNSSLLGTLSPGEQCLKVGTGVLSKIVTFADKLFANIAGESKEKTNLVQLLSINTKVETYRKSWREKY